MGEPRPPSVSLPGTRPRGQFKSAHPETETPIRPLSVESACVCVACAAVHVRLSAHMFLKCISVGVRTVQLTCLHLQYNHTPSAILQNLDLNPRKHVRTIKLQICSLVREKCVKPFIVSALNIYF